MKTEEIKDLFEKFESIACEYQGVECWSTRELCDLLGYAKWERFEDVIARAKEACENAGVNPSDHFPSAGKMIPMQVVNSGSITMLNLMPTQTHRFTTSDFTSKA